MTDIPPLPREAILLIEVGSTAHGTGLPGGEDHDEMAVVVETPQQVFGTDKEGLRTRMQRTQPEGSRSGPGDTDRTLYSLRTFLRLAAAGNPSILLAFWAPIIDVAPLGLELRERAPLFVGPHIIARYRGYMSGQARRILGLERARGHGKRGGGQRAELVDEHGFDTKYAMHCSRLGFQCLELLDAGRLELPIAGEPGAWLRRLRLGEVPFEEWWERTLAIDAELARRQDVRMAAGELSAGPDKRAIAEWSYRAHVLHWEGKARRYRATNQEESDGGQAGHHLSAPRGRRR